MGDGIALAGSAMVARELRQEALVHNLANLSTPGFKAARVFAKVMDDVRAGGDAARQVARDQEGYIDFSQGSVQRTGRDLDLALDGEGFFVVLTADGERFTRNGNFSLDAGGQLVNASGLPVLTDAGPVVIDGAEVVIDETGGIYVDQQWVGTLEIRNFASTGDLIQEGAGLYGPRPGAGLKEAEPTARVCQRCLEDSNVTGFDEMVRMTFLLREYEASQRVLQMQNNTLGRTVNELVLK